MVYNGKYESQMDDLGVPPFQGNHQKTQNQATYGELKQRQTGPKQFLDILILWLAPFTTVLMVIKFHSSGVAVRD